MRVLIGTPIHQIKDYSMQRWLKNVASLRTVYPADFLMVDNSPGTDYVKKVKSYCKKYGIKNYKIKHIEVHQANGPDERIGRSREVIRQEILSGDYNAWFSWECDQIIPTNTVDILIKMMQAGKYMMVHPNSWSREVPGQVNASFGCCLINRKALEKYGFLLEYPGMPNCWHGGDVWFKKQVINGGGSYIEIYGIIKPILHLDDPNKNK